MSYLLVNSAHLSLEVKVRFENIDIFLTLPSCIVVIGAHTLPVGQGIVGPTTACLRAGRANTGLVVVLWVPIEAATEARKGKGPGLVAQVSIKKPHEWTHSSWGVPEPHKRWPQLRVDTHALAERYHDVEHVEWRPHEHHR